MKAKHKMCKRNKQCKGFFFYDGYTKACTLYSTVDNKYFPFDSDNRKFCSHEANDVRK